MIELCRSKGIKREYSNSRTPQKNGVAERKNRILIEAARTIIQGTQPIDPPGGKVADSLFPSADEMFQKELARLTVPSGCITVPTGSLSVPTARVPVPTATAMVPIDDVPVPISSLTYLK
nr:putative ribonuclease H-like domain-containing protein [Tanacetum cinerariifolium]